MACQGYICNFQFYQDKTITLALMICVQWYWYIYIYIYAYMCTYIHAYVYVCMYTNWFQSNPTPMPSAIEAALKMSTIIHLKLITLSKPIKAHQDCVTILWDMLHNQQLDGVYLPIVINYGPPRQSKSDFIFFVLQLTSSKIKKTHPYSLDVLLYHSMI